MGTAGNRPQQHAGTQGAEAVYDAKGAMAKATVHYRPLIFCTQHNTFQQVTKKTIHKKPVDEIINIHGIFCPSCLT